MSCKYISDTIAIHIVNKPKNRLDRYYSEVKSTIYGAIKFSGFREINNLDHAFRISNILKLYTLGLFNSKLFDAQIHNFDKGGNVLYKFKYLLKNKEKITDKGRLFLIILTIQGIFLSLKNYKKALDSRRDLKKLISNQLII